MTDHPPDSHMDDFLSLSREYAEALEALGTIEKQAESIVALGNLCPSRRGVVAGAAEGV